MREGKSNRGLEKNKQRSLVHGLQSRGIGSEPVPGLKDQEDYGTMEIRKRKEEQAGNLTVTEQIDQKHQEDLQRLRGFRLLDDDFLTKCFEGDTASIELVLQIVLEKPDLKVLDVRTQVFVENLLNRSVRLDILATDDTGQS